MQASNDPNAQFKRSGPATPEHTPVKRVVVDGATALDKVVKGATTDADMNGAEFFAIIGHLKENHPGGNGLEVDLMKVKRQPDKRRMLVEWIGQKFGAAPASAALPKLALPQSMPTEQQRPSTARQASPARPLLEAPPYAPAQTDRPSTAQAAPVRDMTHVINGGNLKTLPLPLFI